MLESSAETDVVVPSTTSLVVSTTNAADDALTALNSDVSPVARLVAVAVMLAPAVTAAENIPTKVALPLLSVKTSR